MGSRVFRVVIIAILGLLVSLCSAGTLTVTSPTNNGYISPSTSITYNIAQAVVQVTVKVTTTFPNGSSTSSTQQVTPDTNGNATGTINATLSASSPEGVYTIVVSATEPNNTYASTTLTETLLPLAPKFNSFSPPDGTFENGTVHIRGQINDDHLQMWTVQVNGQSIPNNTGTTTQVSVDWDTSGVEKDGQQTITITATDLANQTTTITSTVTLCRVPPVITIEYPGTGSVIVPGSDINVIVQITGEFAGAIDKTGVTVMAQTTLSRYILFVPFTSLTTSTSSATSSIWTGRIRYVKGQLPTMFRLVVAAQDKAGNGATPQYQLVKIGS